MHAARLLEFGIFCRTSFLLLFSLYSCSLIFLLKFRCLQVLSFDALLLWFKTDWYFLNLALVVEGTDFNLRTERLQLVLFLNLNSYVVLIGGMRFTGSADLNVVIVCVDCEVRKAENFHDLARLFERQVDALLEFVFDEDFACKHYFEPGEFGLIDHFVGGLGLGSNDHRNSDFPGSILLHLETSVLDPAVEPVKIILNPDSLNIIWSIRDALELDILLNYLLAVVLGHWHQLPV